MLKNIEHRITFAHNKKKTSFSILLAFFAPVFQNFFPSKKSWVPDLSNYGVRVRVYIGYFLNFRQINPDNFWPRIARIKILNNPEVKHWRLLKWKNKWRRNFKDILFKVKFAPKNWKPK